VRQTINDPGVSIAIANADNTRNPSPVSPQDSLGYRTLSMTIHQFFPDAIVMPNLVTGGTDASYYTALSPNVYRFLAVEGDISVISMIHGLNERIPPEKYLKAVAFTVQLIENIP
jgi:carboxypeptidase PM20D1